MIMLQLALALGQLLLVMMILVWGGRWDRLAGASYLVAAWMGLGANWLGTPHILVIAFTLTLALFFAFWLLAEKARRWWMVGMAGFQLVALLTYLGPSDSWSRLRGVFVQFHWMMAVVSLACLALAVVEVRLVRS